MTRSAAGLVAALGVLAAGSVRAEDAPSGGGPFTPDVERARQYFKAGVDFYREGDLSASLVEFKRAYVAAPNFRVLYNLGQVSQELREYPDAQRYFEQYLLEGGDTIEPARKQEVTASLARLRTRIATLEFSSDVDGAEFFVDDVSVGHTPFDQPVLVSAGRRRISAGAPGRLRVTEVVDAAGGETHRIRLELPPLDAGRPLADAPAPAAAGGKSVVAADGGPGPALWFGIGTGALAVGASVLAVLAARDGSDYRSALERKISASDLDDLQDRAMAKALATDILLGATALSAGITLYFWLSDDGAETERATALSVGPGSVQIRGAF